MLGSRDCASKKSAFTLIELLVVIAIIAILAAILFPVFAQAKVAAKKSAGLSQMKQIGLAVQMYSTDYDDGIPTWDSYYTVYPTANRDPAWIAGGSVPSWKRLWDALILPYVKSGNFDKATALATAEWAGIFQSPGAEYAPKSPPTGGRSVGMNQLLFWDVMQNNTNTGVDTSYFSGAYYWLNLGVVDKPANTMFSADSGINGRLEPIFFLNSYQEKWLTRVTPVTWGAPWRYGNDSSNYSWLDGHASSEKGDKIYPNPGKGIAFASWPASALGQTYCAAARFQAPRTDMKDSLVAAATARGVACNLP